MPIRVDLRQAIFALSDALDLVGVDDFFHGKRVAIMAGELASAMGLGPSVEDDLFYAGLVHDCGVSSTAVHSHLVRELDWEGAGDHCTRGHRLLSRFQPIAGIGETVLYHHTHWSDFPRIGVNGELARNSNLIFLVDRVDSLAAAHLGSDLLVHKDGIRETVAGLAGTLFSPELTEAFLALSTADAFWLQLEPRHVIGSVAARLNRALPYELDHLGLRQLAKLFSIVVDAKSPFTAAHSTGVANLSRWLGERAGLPPETCGKLELAGLLHDLGKLQVPDSILDKHGPLDAEERRIMNRHSFETYQMLRRIPGLEDVAAWAGYHHETLDGSGYPYSLKAGELPAEARIVAVADIFQALAQERPYRGPLPPEAILGELQKRAREGRLDAGIVALVEDRLADCWSVAVAAELPEPA
jgi:HD-GYP domain-containing protein (c-di-GMP phosphodiesterase class II)